MLVAGVAHSGDAEAHEFCQSVTGVLKMFPGRQLEIGGPFRRIEFPPLEKKMGMRLDQARQQRGVGRGDVGAFLPRTQQLARRRPATTTHEADDRGIVDHVHLAPRRRACAVEQRADLEPDGMAARGGRDIHREEKVPPLPRRATSGSILRIHRPGVVTHGHDGLGLPVPRSLLRFAGVSAALGQRVTESDYHRMIRRERAG